MTATPRRSGSTLLLLGLNGPFRPRMVGTYQDTLRREPEGWLFAKRELRVHARQD